MKKFKHIYLIDQTSEGNHHMVFNTALVKVLSLIHKDIPFIYYGTPSSIQSIKSLLSTDEINSIQFRNIQYSFAPNSFALKILNYGLKEIKRMFNFIQIFNKSSSEDLIVLSVTTFTSFLGFKFLKLCYQTPTIAVLHGDVDFVYNSKDLLSKINGIFHKIIFKIPARNFRYLTLNKIEKKILVADGYLKNDEVYEIEHPFLNIKEAENTHIPQLPLKLGHIGSMEIERKNSHYTFLLAEKAKSLIQDHKVQFKSIGLMTPGLKPYKNDLVELIVGNQSDDSPQYLSREQYEIELENLDYILFFYPPTEYIFRASGAVVDFLAKNKPIICLKHPLFEYMFDKAGNIGFMCEDIDAIYKLLEKITSSTYDLSTQYAQQVDNITNYKQEFTVTNVAKDLENQIQYNPLSTA